MVAINLNTKRIFFKKGMTDDEKYAAIKKIWKVHYFLSRYPFPKFRIDRESMKLLPIPEELKFN